MKPFRALVTLLALVIIAGAGFLWLNRPRRVDMAGYVPADSLVYLEFNSLPDLARAIEQNDTWKAAAKTLNTDSRLIDPFWSAIARSGAAPAKSVVLSRAQVALVLVGMNSIPDGDTLRIRPEVALVVETHTASWRIRTMAADAVKTLAAHAYGQSNCVERSGDAYYVDCSSSTNGRKLMATVDGSVVIIGNTETAIRACLDVRQGSRPSLRTDPELQRSREQLNAADAFSFGYVSSANVAKIFSWAAPVLMGRAPGDPQLEQLLATSAGKILKSVAWASRSLSGGMEDRYLISLDSDLLPRIEPVFATTAAGDDGWKHVPSGAETFTLYQVRNPLDALNAMNSAVSYKLDALSAVMFSSLLRSSLAVYGVENPTLVLPLVSPPLVTLRAKATDESSVLIARVNDPGRLRSILESQKIEGGIRVIDLTKDWSNKGSAAFLAVMVDGYVVMGKTESVDSWFSLTRSSATASEKPTAFQQVKPNENAVTITYANDSTRVSSFVSTINLLRGNRLSDEQSAAVMNATKASSFSITESRLDDRGIERTTRSPFGQMSTLMSLLQSDTSAERK
ncbi:MAG TPA: hypothetical protein VL866_22755 [Pyrinomonadaceae bacterium]|nr:hypothetical protein [Pyrinomonadaceae bacterium]